jgi:hypothetical protein
MTNVQRLAAALISLGMAACCNVPPPADKGSTPTPASSAGGGTAATATAKTTATATAAAPKEAATPIEAKKLVADYKANEVKGDSLYKGKVFAVTGVVGDIKKGLLNDIYVTIGDGGPLSVLENVQCYPSKELEAKAAELKKGQKITATGRVSGFTIASVGLHDCTF